MYNAAPARALSSSSYTGPRPHPYPGQNWTIRSREVELDYTLGPTVSTAFLRVVLKDILWQMFNVKISALVLVQQSKKKMSQWWWWKVSQSQQILMYFIQIWIPLCAQGGSWFSALMKVLDSMENVNMVSLLDHGIMLFSEVFQQ